jgi:hypothetical protein
MTLLKSKLSGLYFKNFGVWVHDPDEAHPFGDEWTAREFIRTEHIQDVAVAEQGDTRAA